MPRKRSDETPEMARARTAAARAAMAAKFSTPEEKSEYFKKLSRRSHEVRVVLGRDTVDCLIAELTDADRFLGKLLNAAEDYFGEVPPPMFAAQDARASIERAYQLVSDLKAAQS